MSYKAFLEVLKDTYQQYLPEEFKGCKLEITSVLKNNGVRLEAIRFVKNKTDIVPTIYPEHYYEELKKIKTNEEIIKQIVEDGCQINNGLKSLLNSNNIKDNITFQLINARNNKEILENIPYRMFNNLAVVYRWIVNIDESGVQSTLVTNALVKTQLNDMTENELFNLAYKNTKRLFPPVINSMAEVIQKLINKDEMPEELFDEYDVMQNNMRMYIITNNKGINGASSIIYIKDTLGQLADKLQQDLYVLPSSIHEVIAMPVGNLIPKDLVDMVKDINASVVLEQEVLSNSVYLYNRAEEQLNVVASIV